MSNELAGKKVAILVTDGFEYVELTEPRKALDQAGASTFVISPHAGKIRGFDHHEPGDSVSVDRTLDDARPEDFDALLLPGGVMNPDALRMDPHAVGFVKAFAETNRPIAAICHGPWTLVEADVVRGRRMTSWPSVKTDLTNAGAIWLDEASVTDGNITSSRKPDDIPLFNRAMIDLFAQRKEASPA